jgi:hypothetical protein
MAVYNRPDLPEGVKPVNLVPLGATQELEPKTRVLIVNRGDAPYRDKFDGRDYIVPGATVAEVEYEVANHFRERSVVAGSRDPVTGKQDRRIAILGIDKPERCELLTPVENEKAAKAVEAIDREALGDDKAVVVPTARVRARTIGLGKRGKQQLTAETNDGQELDVNDVLAPVEGGDAMRQIARDSAERAAEE